MYLVEVRSREVICDTPEEAVALARLIAKEREDAKRRAEEMHDKLWIASMHQPVFA